MSIRDWVELALLVVLTILSIGRWAQSREERERASSAALGLTAKDLEESDRRNEQERERLWTEVNRNRDHWHKEMVPWMQRVAVELATTGEQCREREREMKQIWAAIERRRETRD